MALRNWKQMQPFRPWFHRLRSKIARNPLKVYMHAYLSNGYLNSLSNFNYKKVKKVASPRPLLEQLSITSKITLNIMKGCVHSYLSNGHPNL